MVLTKKPGVEVTERLNCQCAYRRKRTEKSEHSSLQASQTTDAFFIATDTADLNTAYRLGLATKAL